jgi:hypothetical protein
LAVKDWRAQQLTVSQTPLSAPIFDLCEVLAHRGHVIEFATFEGQESWTKEYAFIKKVYTLGPGPSADLQRAHYKRSVRMNPRDGVAPLMASKYMLDETWPTVYARLKCIAADVSTRPDFVIADFFADTPAKDMKLEFNIQIALVWPQMPYLLAPASYIPGQPGFQMDITLTSEHASMWSRLSNELVMVRAIPHVLSWMWWFKSLRTKSHVGYAHPPATKPDYLVLVNSFFGLETPKELPPLMAAVGPILRDDYPPLSGDIQEFLAAHNKTMYLSLGTHVAPSPTDMRKIVEGVLVALDSSVINGIIWSIGKVPREEVDRKLQFQRPRGPVYLGDILDGKCPAILPVYFAPQRAVLEHKNTVLYFTHGGGSSANEALFHGTPVLVLGFYFDQLCNSARLVNAGVGLTLDKLAFTAEEISDKIARIIQDNTQWFGRNVERMKRIARLAARRKYLGADLIEEVMYDHQLRFVDGREVIPMHLQTADMRMPVWKAKNWDLWAVSLSSVFLGTYGSWWVGKIMYFHRNLMFSWISSIWGQYVKMR